MVPEHSPELQFGRLANELSAVSVGDGTNINQFFGGTIEVSKPS